MQRGQFVQHRRDLLVRQVQHGAEIGQGTLAIEQAEHHALSARERVQHAAAQRAYRARWGTRRPGPSFWSRGKQRHGLLRLALPHASLERVEWLLHLHRPNHLFAPPYAVESQRTFEQHALLLIPQATPHDLPLRYLHAHLAQGASAHVSSHGWKRLRRHRRPELIELLMLSEDAQEKVQGQRVLLGHRCSRKADVITAISSSLCLVIGSSPRFFS